MTKTFKFQSKFLNILNETIQKFGLNNELEVSKYPFMEADGNFTSIVKTSDTFDPSKVNSNILVSDEENSDDKKEDRDYLVSKATDAITQTLKTTDELQSILNQIKKINAETHANDWNLNEEGNTATLKNKNAQIFKQNDNLCLSHDNKIEVFKSVEELHDWLNKNNYPLPKDIKLHEALNEVNSEQTETPQSVTNQDMDISKLNYTYRYLKNKNSPWFDILIRRFLDSGYIPGVPIPPMSDVEKEELNRKRQKPAGKMSRNEYSRNTEFWTAKDWKPKPTKNDIADFLPEAVEDWYLQYMDNNSDKTLYLNKDWNNELLTDSLENAVDFFSRDNAVDYLDIIYSSISTEAPFKPVQVSDINECCGVGVGSLGSAVQYLGDKKESSLDETTYGYAGTPFATKVYKSGNAKRDRAKDYFNWVLHPNEKGGRNIDPNFEENFREAIADQLNHAIRDRVNTEWYKLFKDFGPRDFNPDGTIIPEKREQFVQRINEVNNQFGLNLNPNKPIFGTNKRNNAERQTFKIDEQNQIEKKKWEELVIPAIRENLKTKAIRELEVRKKEYEDELSKPVIDNEKINKLYNSLVAYNDTGVDFDIFTNKVAEYKQKLDPEEYNVLIDTLVNAYNKDEIALDDPHLKLLKLSKKIDILNLDESVKPNNSFNQRLYELLNKKRKALTEDESPADFASGGADTGSTPEINVSSDTQMNDINDTSDLDMDSGEGMDSAGFGDLNLNLGGDYGPDEGDEESMAPVPDSPEYRIIDVLVNDNDESDIKVKVQNLDTDEIETKNLYEIDI